MTKEPTGEDVAGLHLDIEAGSQGIFPGDRHHPPMISVQGAWPDCYFLLDANEAREVAASLVRAADVLDAHLAQEAKR